jgi:hypothetical protein
LAFAIPVYIVRSVHEPFDLGKVIIHSEAQRHHSRAGEVLNYTPAFSPVVFVGLLDTTGEKRTGNVNVTSCPLLKELELCNGVVELYGLFLR